MYKSLHSSSSKFIHKLNKLKKSQHRNNSSKIGKKLITLTSGNRVCNACSARGPIVAGAQTNPVWKRRIDPFEILAHAGPLQPRKATEFDRKKITNMTTQSK